MVGPDERVDAHGAATARLTLHVLLEVAPSAEPGGEAAVCGLLTLEHYEVSDVALIGYLVTSPAFVRQGVAKRLCQHAAGVLGAGVPLVVESHRADVADAVMSPADRLATYARLGFYPLDLAYTVPSVTPDEPPCADTYVLLLHTAALDAQGHFATARLRAFLVEYYAASATRREDMGALTAMLDWCDAQPVLTLNVGDRIPRPAQLDPPLLGLK